MLKSTARIVSGLGEDTWCAYAGEDNDIITIGKDGIKRYGNNGEIENWIGRDEEHMSDFDLAVETLGNSILINTKRIKYGLIDIISGIDHINLFEKEGYVRASLKARDVSPYQGLMEHINIESEESRQEIVATLYWESSFCRQIVLDVDHIDRRLWGGGSNNTRFKDKLHLIFASRRKIDFVLLKEHEGGISMYYKEQREDGKFNLFLEEITGKRIHGTRNNIQRLRGGFLKSNVERIVSTEEFEKLVFEEWDSKVKSGYFKKYTKVK
jgi:hypothetical protein